MLTLPSRDLDHHAILTALATAIPARRYLEIGVQEGTSLAAVLDAGVTEHLTLIDPWGDTHGGTARGNHAHITAMLAARHYPGGVVYADGLSVNYLPALVRDRATFDLIHIDGDHTKPGARFDMEYRWPLLAPGGVMVVHDAHYLDVKRAIVEFVAEMIDRMVEVEATLYPAALGTMILRHATEGA